MVQIQNRQYWGNKYKLTKFIHDTVEQDCGKIDSVFDVFAGTGVVAYSYMTQARVVVNYMYYNITKKGGASKCSRKCQNMNIIMV